MAFRTCCAHAGQTGRASSGCLLAPDRAERLLAKQGLSEAARPEQMIPTSGDRQFDIALALTLSRISDVFDVLPEFAFYDDQAAPNAHATTARRLAHSDGTVLFGIGLMRRVLADMKTPDAVIAAFCAHEFGHIVQFKHNLVPTLIAGQTTVKRAELHADFLAGYYAGTRKLRKHDYPAVVFIDAARSIGDVNQSSQGHHGYAEERAAAVTRGFETAYRERRPLGEAVQIGVSYVKSL